jgi:hypothetical protein
VVTAITHMCDTSICKELFQSSPAPLTVNQAAGPAANAAAAAAAAQPAKTSHTRYLIPCSMTPTNGQHDRTGGGGGAAPPELPPTRQLLVLQLMPRRNGSGSPGYTFSLFLCDLGGKSSAVNTMAQP